MVSEGRAASDGALGWIAAERGVRAAILVAVGVVFLTHTQTDWGRVVTDAARHLGLDPSRNAVEHLSGRARRLAPGKLRRYGAVAVAYGMLEAAESYGLGRRRRWGEYLTVAATSVLLIPETGELATKPSPLKALTLVINAAIVAYLVVRLRHREPSPAT